MNQQLSEISLKLPQTMSPGSKACRICGNKERNNYFKVREMMQGTREEFDYLECTECGCVQIAAIPDDLSKYYVNNYYSLAESPLPTSFLRSWAKAAVMRPYLARSTAQGVKRKLLGSICDNQVLLNLVPTWLVPDLPDYKLSKEWRILDVGSGTGTFLHWVRERGFPNLLGLDPFIEKDITYANGVRVIKGDVFSIEGSYDLIMLHHSFEHMPEPVAVLRRLSELVRPEGYILIRIPVADSYAWREYRTNWVQLDAPRHLHLHTRRSMELMAERVGLRLATVVCDSTSFQFWGSEQYRRDISLLDMKSAAIDSGQSDFSNEDIRGFELRASELNRTNYGDQACFYLRRPE